MLSIAGVVLVLALWVSAVLERRVLRQAVDDLSLRKVAANTIRAALLVLGLLLALSAVGVDLTALSVLGGALGVGLGFGLQKLALATRGSSVEIAYYLAPEEKAEFADHLSRALAEARRGPRFD